MAFDFSTLEPSIHKILSAPGTDLTTISARGVRRQLLVEEPSLTPEFVRDNKQAIDVVIGKVFETVNAAGEAGGHYEDDVGETVDMDSGSRKRKQNDEEDYSGETVAEDEDEKPTGARPPKKAKKLSKTQISGDAELARQLSDELNGRSRRTSAKSRGTSNGTPKRGGRAKKSAAVVDSDHDSDADDGTRKRGKKQRSGGTGASSAKGGFAKEYSLSEPLAALLNVDKLSRPQVVKQLWVHIKDNGLQNPDNKREIICDDGLRAIFGVDKIDMFKMNKVLGQHLHENES